MLVLFISLIGSSYPDKDLHIHINALNGAGKNRLAPQSGGIGKRFKAIHKDYGMGGGRATCPQWAKIKLQNTLIKQIRQYG